MGQFAIERAIMKKGSKEHAIKIESGVSKLQKKLVEYRKQYFDTNLSDTKRKIAHNNWRKCWDEMQKLAKEGRTYFGKHSLF
jgi:hypothetical protein